VPKVDRPPHVHTEDDRRQMLAWLIEQNGGMMEVSRNSGVSRGHLRRLVRGYQSTSEGDRAYSLLEASIETISGLLSTFSLSDERAWEMLNIPLERRAQWRSIQKDGGSPAPVNPQLINVLLDEPLVGDLFIPSGYIIIVDESDTENGVQVASVNGRLYALRPDALPAIAQVRGRFVGTRI